jgi:hypothetical protein
MASPAFGAVGTLTAVNGTTNVPRPSVSEGDLMVMFYSITSSDADFAPPGDWTLIQSRDPDDVFQSEGGAYYKVAGPSEGANYSVTVSGQGGGNNFADVIIASWTGADTTTPIEVSAEQDNASSTNVDCPSVTTASTDTTLVCYYLTRGSAATFTPPSGMTERHDGTTGGSPAFSFADVAVASTGATGTKTATASTAIESYALSFAIASGGAAEGTITTLPLSNNTGSLLASTSGISAFVHNPTTGALVVLVTGLSTDAAGVLEITDALLEADTSYRVVIRVTGTGAEGMDTYTAA